MIDKPTLDDLTAWIRDEVRLPIKADKELQLAALLSTTLAALTQIGPKTTKRVLEWAFDRHGVTATVYTVEDRRPKSVPLPVLPPPPPKPETRHFCPECDRSFITIQGLRGHQRVHRKQASS